MKFLLSCSVLCLGLNVFCQSSLYDSLKKYTYMVVGIKNRNQTELYAYPIGSCFFVRKESRLYFITAKHVITGYDPFTKKHVGEKFDTIGIRYLDENNVQRCSIFSTKELKEGFSIDYYYESSDVAILEQTDSLLNKSVLSVENYLFYETEKIKNCDSVISIGYGIIDKRRFNNATPSLYGRGIIIPTRDNSFSYHINDSLFYVAKMTTWPGMSGSPVFKVFYRLNTNNKIEHIAWGGELFGRNGYSYSFIVNPENIQAQILNSPPIIISYVPNELSIQCP